MKIKMLEWTENQDGDFEASGFWGMFQVTKSREDDLFTASLNDANNYEGYEEEDFPTAEEGKAYCQTLHEKQVRAAMGFVEQFVEEPKKNDEESESYDNLKNEWKNALKLIEILFDALDEAHSHLEYCCYGDAWESECAYDEKLPEKLETALKLHEDWKNSLSLPGRTEKK